MNCLSFLLKELKGHINNSKDSSNDNSKMNELIKVVQRLQLAYGMVTQAVFVVSITYIVFGSSIFLLHLSTYLLLILHIQAPLISIFLVVTMSKKSNAQINNTVVINTNRIVPVNRNRDDETPFISCLSINLSKNVNEGKENLI